MAFARKLVVLLVLCAMTGLHTQTSSAEVITNEWQEFVTFPVNTCNGEFVPVLSGVAHVVQRLQPDGSFVTSTNGHFVASGTLGNRYQLNWQERFVGAPGQTTFSSRQLVVSEGSAPNHLVTFVFEFPPARSPQPKDASAAERWSVAAIARCSRRNARSSARTLP